MGVDIQRGEDGFLGHQSMDSVRLDLCLSRGWFQDRVGAKNRAADWPEPYYWQYILKINLFRVLFFALAKSRMLIRRSITPRKVTLRVPWDTSTSHIVLCGGDPEFQSLTRSQYVI